MVRNDGPSHNESGANSKLASVVDLDALGIVESCNSLAGITLGCEKLIGRPFVDLLSDAAKFGVMSNLAVDQIMSGIERGSTKFHTEDGRTFFLQSQPSGKGRHVEWMDISIALADAGNQDPATGLLSREGLIEALNVLLGQATESLVFHLEIDDFGGLTVNRRTKLTPYRRPILTPL